ncbi:MAG: hypothetical protein IT463_06055, partial [Planctomycetes bacterium]|nr:hypothetical protein [Planctomycetota bacterium]
MSRISARLNGQPLLRAEVRLRRGAAPSSALLALPPGATEPAIDASVELELADAAGT